MENRDKVDRLVLTDKQVEYISRGIDTIDRVVNGIVLPYSIMPNNKVMLSFARIFSHKDDDLVAHYLDKFIHNSNKDWGLYMLNAECQIVREFFTYHSIPMEEDKISDEIEMIEAQLSGINKFDIYPFEYEITRRFFLFANNHSLDSLDKGIEFMGVKEDILEKKIDFYGNGLNWSKAWNCFHEFAKEAFILMVLEYQ
ncbi:hypothetical protein [Parabacteroides sp. PF5-9]|uniref:hypothetical protein n=1 Tax=Parabacteroides sp. PF5-9 TaxID=1742404 RepID=UPI0024747947|nr:hypothetical protein [Parabacteroides sp. PF5-9]MDH6358947.1 hypothetical protein [Parabacteroides sp. PF5-9]